MNADTITIERILDLHAVLEAATVRVGSLAREAADGGSPAEIAEEINEIIENIQRANS